MFHTLCPFMTLSRLLSAALLGLAAISSFSALAAAQTSQAPAPSARDQSSLSGTVRGRGMRLVGGARVTLNGAQRTAFSNDSGHFRFAAITPGRYTLRVTNIGYSPAVADDVVVTPGSAASVDIQLDAAAQALSQVTITPGSFTLLDPASSSRLSLSREALLTAPQLAEDVFRSLNRLPGLSGSDFSAKTRIRNGGVDEQLFTLDGLELVEPFHLKDFDGALSILDGEVIGRVAVTTGGFSAAAGNRMAGLVEMQTATPSAARRQTAVGVSISNLRARNEGTFASGRGSWLVSARRGYLDLILRLVDEEDPPDPRYFDVFGKAQYRLLRNHTATVHGLLANDNLSLLEDNGSFLTSKYGNRYLWATLRSSFGPRVNATTLASVSRLRWDRSVVDIDRLRGVRYERVRIADRRTLGTVSLKQDWAVDATDAVSLLFGGELRDETTDYAYARTQVERAVVGTSVVALDSARILAKLQPGGARTSVYGTLRLRPIAALTLDAGARADRHTWTKQTTIGPRVNAAWTPFTGTTLRGAWGYFHQAHALQDLSIIDGDTAFARAERAEHRVLGLEQDLGRGWTGRIEAYQRLIARPRARYFNIDGSTTSPLPEGAEDRVRIAPSSAAVRGIELLAQYDRGGHWRGGGAFVASRATAIIAGQSTPRPFDEPYAATADIAYRGTGGWTVALAWTTRAGWPITSPRFAIDTLAPGRYAARRLPSSPYLRERLAAYQRLDVRATRTWRTARGRINLWMDVFNLLDHANQSGYTYESRLTSPTLLSVTRGRDDFLGRLPTAGISWEF